jgi:hypothetical protein
MKHVVVRRSLIALALAASTYLPVMARAEPDHLVGYRVRDNNNVPGRTVVMTDQFGTHSCNLRGVRFFLVQGEKDGGDDPRGGPAGRFACYRARCQANPPPISAADSQFGVHSMQRIGSDGIVCLPVDTQVCGDNNLDPGEQCDGAVDGACPGLCTSNCICATPCASSGGDPEACTSYMTNAACRTCCFTDTTCQAACSAAEASTCTVGPANDACAVAVDALSNNCIAACCN